MDVAGSAPRRGNSHILSTHHYELTTASCIVLQDNSSPMFDPLLFGLNVFVPEQATDGARRTIGTAG
jgi:hypothetical protein